MPLEIEDWRGDPKQVSGDARPAWGLDGYKLRLVAAVARHPLSILRLLLSLRALSPRSPSTPSNPAPVLVLHGVCRECQSGRGFSGVLLESPRSALVSTRCMIFQGHGSGWALCRFPGPRHR